MPLGKVRYRYKKGTKIRLAFKDKKLVESKNMRTGATHTANEFAHDEEMSQKMEHPKKARKPRGYFLIPLLLSILPFLPGEVRADALGCPGINVPIHPLVSTAQNALSVSSTAVTLTVPRGAMLATVFVETDAIRYTTDGTTPTATVGTRVSASTSFTVCGSTMDRIKLIRVTGDATVDVEYFGLQSQ